MTSVIKLQAPFEKIKLANVSPDIALRRAIILQAIIDASNVSDTKIAKKIEKDAKSWIFGNSEYFQRICEEADLDVNMVINMTNDIIQLHQVRKSKKLSDR